MLFYIKNHFFKSFKNYCLKIIAVSTQKQWFLNRFGSKTPKKEKHLI